MECYNVLLPALAKHQPAHPAVQQPPREGATAFCVIDFASSLEHVRPYTGTCQHPENSHLCVAVICHSPSCLEASKIPDEKHRKRVLKKGHTVKLMYKTAVCHACSKARACATLQASFLAMLTAAV